MERLKGGEVGGGNLEEGGEEINYGWRGSVVGGERNRWDI